MDADLNKDTPIKSWWRKVIRSTNNNKSTSQKQEDDHDQIFGVPLKESLKCARAAIAYIDNDVQYVGFIPVIVAKCGSYLKDQGFYTEGVFRMSGSAKRIGQLQQIFTSSPDYGRQLDWKGFSVHDAANVLRRFLNYMPEPVIVHQLYQPFRDVIIDNQSEEEKVLKFQNLIDQLPENHQYLLFYLLDLLSLFSQNVQITKMDTFNLASVFTPGILLNPEHALNPAQYKTSQKVVQFLIEHQHCFTMPRSSYFTELGQQKQKEKETSSVEKETLAAGVSLTTAEKPDAIPVDNRDNNTDSSSKTTTKLTHAPYRHKSQPIHQHNINSNSKGASNFNIPNCINSQQKPLDLTSDSIFSSPLRPLSVVMSSQKESRVKRAKTMPSRRSRYGPNDPVQIVQLNKSLIETGQRK